MYINDVIRRAEAYCPSEYSEEEMYQWCDEVSAMLATEDRIIYREIRPPIAADNTVLLPEGVKLENISHVYSGTKEIPVRSMREVGRRLSCDRQMEDIRIVFSQPYYPIRRINYSGDITVDGDTITIKDCEFVSGDTVNITIGSDTATAHVLAVDYDTDDIRAFILTVGEDELDGLSSGTGTITREITDKTVCDAPFDGMYIDYVMAKIAQYQRDTAAYNIYITAFNSKLQQYKGWLTARLPHEPVMLRNFW